MRPLTARLEDGYCSITVVNHELIRLIRFVAQSCTHLWKDFTNKLRLALHAYNIPFQTTGAMLMGRRAWLLSSAGWNASSETPGCVMTRHGRSFITNSSEFASKKIHHKWWKETVQPSLLIISWVNIVFSRPVLVLRPTNLLQFCMGRWITR